MSKAVANLTQYTETITFSAQDNGETINVKINELARGPAGADGPNSVTSATTSDGTANLSLSNVTTATATVTGTLTADHIHGNLAGSVYAHVRAGENLAKGDPVYISGSHGSGSTLIAIVSKADASDPLKMPAVGVMDAAVTANANGHMVITGQVYDINTASYSVNAELYVAEGGGFTATPPSAYAQPVARVERSNTNNGSVIVKVNGLSAISPTASTLVRRDSSGVSDFNTINLGNLHTGGSPSAPYGSIGKSVLTGSSGVGISGNPDVALEAATHRLTLSSTGVAIASGTITTSQPLSLTQTWNAGAVTFKGIDVNVTDTASASGSLLMDLRVGGVSRTSVSKAGETKSDSFSVGNGTSDFAQVSTGKYITFGKRANGVGTIQYATNGFVFSDTTNNTFQISVNGNNTIVGSLGFTASQFAAGTAGDVIIARDASNTLAQRNGTNAQESRVYGTYTSATNFERLNLKYNGTANAFQIGTEKGTGGGVARPLEFQTDGTTRMTIGTTGSIALSNNINSNTYGISITNTNTGGAASSQVSLKNHNNKGGAISAPSSSYGFGLADNFTIGSDNSIIVIANGEVASGGTGSIQFRAGGYGTNQERFRITSTGAVTFGGATSSFPALKPSSAILQARLADDSGYTTIDAQLRAQGTAPASATAAGTAGDIRYDADYIYICTATNTWKRAALATWP